MTLPTALTLLRIFLVFVIVFLLTLPGWLPALGGLFAFLIASLTDWLDGYLARRWRQTSSLGALLDPIADKVLVLGLFAAMIPLQLVAGWMVALIAIRELGVTLLRLVVVRRGGKVISAALEGKIKTATQLSTLGLMLALESVQRWARLTENSVPLLGFLQVLVSVGIWLTVAITIFSGFTFCWRHRLLLRSGC